MSQLIFKLPDLGEGVVEGEIVAWHVQPGESVVEDQPLVDMMTDKATVTIPSPASGRVLATHGDVGQMVAVGGTLLAIDLTGLHVPQVDRSAALAAAREVAPDAKLLAAGQQSPHEDSNAIVTRLSISQAVTTGPDQSLPSSGVPLASPAVRRRARERNVDLATVQGTGPGGRVTDDDVLRHVRDDVPQRNGQRSRRNGTREIPIAGLRRQIAKKMQLSAQTIPHFSYFEQVDITELDELRCHLNARENRDQPKLTYLPFIMLAVARTMRDHPEMNATYNDDREVVTQYEGVHLGIATQTDRGLNVPVIRHAEALGLWQAAGELQRIVKCTRDGTITRDQLTGSTFTIASLGKLGGLAATPIINHPEVAILGVHRAIDQPVVRDGQVTIRRIVTFSASFDHRIVDGSDAAAMIQTLRSYLEHPGLIFIE